MITPRWGLNRNDFVLEPRASPGAIDLRTFGAK